jgi:VIT1/CCC1 family predicted Fe2+/Mn2+ transporter
VTGWIRLITAREHPVILRRENFKAAARIVALVVLSTLPPVAPLLLTEDVFAAMRWSNGVAVAMLFLIGWQLDRHISHGSRLIRLVVPLIGIVLVAVTIALGG